MPIKLVTGLPGAGKSLRAVMLITQALEVEKREVYVCGLDGIIDLGQQPLDDPNRWQDLPDGSLVVIDEAQKWWGQRRMGEPLPPIRALSEHRHRGFDFIILTQHPTMLDKYVRTLVGEHQHILRQFGAEVSRIITWSECQDDPQSLAIRQRGTESIWRYPKELFGKYKSATLHTVKKRLPFRLLVLPVLIAFVVGLGWYGYKSVTAIGGKSPSTAAPSSATAPIPAAGIGVNPVAGKPPVTQAEYVAERTPRVPHQPWSMPILDERTVTAEPDLYCMSSETGTCTCMTEQGTRYQIDPRQCMTIARWGNYNPYRKSMASFAGGQQQPAAQQPAPPVPPEFIGNATDTGTERSRFPAYRPPGTL